MATPATNNTPPPADRTPSFSDRYSRQVLFPGIGPQGQQRLATAHATIIGVGATGAATAMLLARAGIGHLTLIDRDFVESSNLQRQILFDESDALATLPKAEAARLHLARINSELRVTAHIADLVPANIDHLLAVPADATTTLLLDCTDNFETRYLLNDYATRESRPWIYAAAVGAYAATMNILPQGVGPRVEGQGSRAKGQETGLQEMGRTAQGPDISSNSSQLKAHSSQAKLPSRPGAPDDEPLALGPQPLALSPRPLTLVPPTACLACIFPTLPTGHGETCDTAGILSTAVNLAASLQVTEALKYLTGQPHLMRRTLLSHDLWTGEHTEINTARPRPTCEVCAPAPVGQHFRYLAGEHRPQITLCGRNSVQIHEHHRPLDLHALHARLAPLGDTRTNGHLLRFHHGPHTLTIFPDGRALIQGTTDPTQARTLYARFIGS